MEFYYTLCITDCVPAYFMGTLYSPSIQYGGPDVEPNKRAGTDTVEEQIILSGGYEQHKNILLVYPERVQKGAKVKTCENGLPAYLGKQDRINR